MNWPSFKGSNTINIDIGFNDTQKIHRNLGYYGLILRMAETSLKDTDYSA